MQIGMSASFFCKKYEFILETKGVFLFKDTETTRRIKKVFICLELCLSESLYYDNRNTKCDDDT